jgi:multiple sugar transport system permease protein
MPLIPTVGRKSARMRVLVATLYVVLSLGAVTMVYPFVLMLGASVTSQYDQDKYDLIPRYLYSNQALYGKYVEDKFGGDFASINAAFGTNFATWDDIHPPKATSPAQVQRWNEFVAALPNRFKTAGFAGDTAADSPSLLLDRYRDFLRRLFHGDIRILDRAYTEEDTSFLTVFPPFEQPASHAWAPDNTQKSQDWTSFQKSLPKRYFIVDGGDAPYQTWLTQVAYPSLAALNTAWKTKFSSFEKISLTAKPMGNAAEQADWATFVRTKLPFRDVVVSPAALPAYQAFLRAKHQNTLSLPDPDALPPGTPRVQWLEFLKTAPVTDLTVDTPETRWGGPIGPLAQASAWADVQARPGALRWNFVTRNYGLVADYMLLHGRAVWNTFLYSALLVLTTLIVNPLCAYALSRYNLSYGNSVLLFLLATMAFPSEVTMIPNFLLLKQFHFLNTFGALLLPGIASGFSIFLMKGFFDSLPRELYEAGMLDGASEARLFWQITFPLSRPIFAVIGLGAFTTAYTAFLFAMVICQDPKMWTLMVWLYELSSSGAPQYIMMAAATLATLPTLFVFLFAQNTIMKGIILPSYK